MALRQSKKISELTSLVSASLETVVVGVDNGTTYKIGLDILADGVRSTINTLDVARLNSLEAATGSYIKSLNGTISGSQQISNLGFITSSNPTDISALNSFTSSQNTKNTAYENGISGRLTTASFNDYVASQSTSSLVNRLNAIETISGSWITESETGSFLTNLNGAISSSSQLTSSYDVRYVLSGSITQTTWDNIANKPSNIVSSSTQISNLGFITSSDSTNISALNSFTSSQNALNTAYQNGINARLQTSSFNDFSTSVDSRLDILEISIITGSANYIQILGNQRTGITSSGSIIISGSITTSGNPVQIMVTGDANPIGGAAWVRMQLYRNNTPIGNIVQAENGSNLNVPYCLNIIDTPSAGTYTYSMRTGTMSGTIDFGEASGPTLTIVELKTNTNLANSDNTFGGANTFTGPLNVNNGVGSGGSLEGGEIDLIYAASTTLTGSFVALDVYGDKVRIFEGGGNARGVSIDLSKAPNGVGGELVWKASGIVNAGTYVTLDNLKATVPTSGNRGLLLVAVSSTFTANVGAHYTTTTSTTAGGAGVVTITTTTNTPIFNWNFTGQADTSTYIISDITNSRVYRIHLMIGGSYNNNFISIERLY